jgi:4'-phosphopantetheinyl transferase
MHPTPPPAETVHLWLIGSDLPASRLAELADLLDDDERRRVQALTLPRHQRRFIAAHGAARVIIGEQLDVAPAGIRWQHGPNGKPELASGDLHVNLSHSGDLAVLALTRGRSVGVDVQGLFGALDAVRLSGRYFPPEEAQFVCTSGGPAAQLRRFVMLWTRKEACVKASGGRMMTQGLRLPVRGTGDTRRGSGTGIVVTDPGGALPGPYLVRDVPVPQGFRAAVAVTDARPYRVSSRWWPAGTHR